MLSCQTDSSEKKSWPSGTVDATARKHIVEGTDHPIQKTGSSSRDTVQNVDHPVQRIGHSSGNTAEGIDHPVQRVGSNKKNTAEGIDHPGWKQVMHKEQTIANKNCRKIDDRSLGRWPKVQNDSTCSRPS